MLILEQTISIKVRLKLNQPTDSIEFQLLSDHFRRACNFVSAYIFNHDFVLNKNAIQKVIYRDLREQFELRSQLAISVIRTVVARYKTVKTQLKQKPYRYNTGKKNDQGKTIWRSISRDLSWLQKPLQFSRPQADLQRERDWSKRQDGTLSVAGFHHRVIVKPICRGFDQYLDGTWKLGVAKLLKVNGKWYLHIAATKALSILKNEQVNNVVGLDRGMRFLTNTFDSHQHSLFFNGKGIMNKRRQYKKLRTKLQRKGTKSAKRRLKQIGQRENRWMTAVNHQITKALVDYYGPNTMFVLEDLTGIRRATEKSRRDVRYERVSWAFYQFEQFLIYKANLNHCLVVKVDAHYTSQRCPRCGQIKKNNRDHQLHQYRCDHCGYSSNDDRICAMNIQELGKQYLSGIEEPHFVKLNQISMD